VVAWSLQNRARSLLTGVARAGWRGWAAWVRPGIHG